MADIDGEYRKTVVEQVLHQEQRRERSEQHEDLQREGDIDSRIAAALSRGRASAG